MIRLINGYAVQVDQYNYSLVRDTGRKDKQGSPVLKYISYHGSLESAIRACRKDCIKRSLMEFDGQLDEAIRVLREQDKEFRSLLRKCIPGGEE